jgi:hypothetical protein
MIRNAERRPSSFGNSWLPSLVITRRRLASAAFNAKDHHMSKRTRHADNSKRQQPIQQQRAQAARQASGQNRAGKRSDEQQAQERSGSERSR